MLSCPHVWDMGDQNLSVKGLMLRALVSVDYISTGSPAATPFCHYSTNAARGDDFKMGMAVFHENFTKVCVVVDMSPNCLTLAADVEACLAFLGVEPMLSGMD